MSCLIVRINTLSLYFLFSVKWWNKLFCSHLSFSVLLNSLQTDWPSTWAQWERRWERLRMYCSWALTLYTFEWQVFWNINHIGWFMNLFGIQWEPIIHTQVGDTLFLSIVIRTLNVPSRLFLELSQRIVFPRCTLNVLGDMKNASRRRVNTSRKSEKTS